PEPTLRHRAKVESWVRGSGESDNPAPERAEIAGGKAVADQPRDSVNQSAITDRGRDLIGRMLDELEAITSHRDELHDIIINVTKDDGAARRRTRLLRSIGLASRVRVLKDLAAAARTLGD